MEAKTKARKSCILPFDVIGAFFVLFFLVVYEHDIRLHSALLRKDSRAVPHARFSENSFGEVYAYHAVHGITASIA